jgi:glycosyltransferase involved in cell wall biosynthesis
MKTLTIYILCHNRPDDTKRAILSVLHQSDNEYKLIVSDNSSTDEVENMVQREFPTVSYIRRVPMLPPIAHFNICIEEAKGDYFCLFHDDDIMETDFVSTIRLYTQKFPQAVAFSSNAHIEQFGHRNARPSFRTFRTYERISSPRDLAMRYFGRSQSGISPFPSYVYNRHLTSGQFIPAEGGKYADVTWLLILAHLGDIIWINQPLITYRMHASNDGNTESRRDRLSFMGYLKRNLVTIGSSVLLDYRFSFIYKKISRDHDTLHPMRHRLAEIFLRHYRWTRYTRADTYQAIYNRALIKWMTK